MIERGAPTLEQEARRRPKPLTLSLDPAARPLELRANAERRAVGASLRARPRARRRSGTTSAAAAVGVAARASAARSQSGVSCSWPTAETIGTRDAGDRAHDRLVAERQAGPRSCRRRARARRRRPPDARSAPREPRRSTAGAPLPWTRVSQITTSAAGKRAAIVATRSPRAAASAPVRIPTARGTRGRRRFRSGAKRPSAASFRFSCSSASRCPPIPSRSIVVARKAEHRPSARRAPRGPRRGRSPPRRGRGRGARTCDARW